MANWLIFVPIVGGLLLWLLPWRNPGAVRARRRARRGRPLDRGRRRLRLRSAGAPVRDDRGLVPGSRRLVQGRALRLLPLAGRPDRRGRGACDRLRAARRARARPGLLRAHARPRRRDGRGLRRPGPAALLRLLRADADPALRPHRGLGRRELPRRRRSSSSSTRWSGRSSCSSRSSRSGCRRARST